MAFMFTHCPHLDDAKESALTVQTIRNNTEMKNIASKVPTPSQDTVLPPMFMTWLEAIRFSTGGPTILDGSASARTATAWTIGL